MSDVSWQMDAITSPNCFYPIIHEISHNEKVDDLRDHEPVANIVMKNCIGGIGSAYVEFCIGVNPENDR